MKKILSILALGIACNLNAGTVAPGKQPVQPTIAEQGPSTAIWGDHARRDGASYSDLGFIHALNNDLNQSGVFIRGMVGGGEYSYYNPALQDSTVTGRLLDADLGVGYRAVMPGLTLSAFAAAHVRDRNLDNNDPSNDLSTGTRWGARFGLEATGNISGFYYSAIGQISTVETAIWTRGRIGYNFGRVTVGPEFIYLNDAMFDERRFGGFVTVQVLNNLSVTASAGSADYGSALGGAGNTPYGALGFVVSF